MTNKEYIDYATKVWIELFVRKSNLNSTDIDTLQECIKKIIESTIEWKEQQMIDKACEWWENELTYPTMSQVEIDWMQTKIVEFRKAMEK